MPNACFLIIDSLPLRTLFPSTSIEIELVTVIVQIDDFKSAAIWGFFESMATFAVTRAYRECYVWEK